jgi:hypothetical protein
LIPRLKLSLKRLTGWLSRRGWTTFLLGFGFPAECSQGDPCFFPVTELAGKAAEDKALTKDSLLSGGGCEDRCWEQPSGFHLTFRCRWSTVSGASL